MRAIAIVAAFVISGCQVNALDVSPKPVLRPDSSNVYYRSDFVDYSRDFSFKEDWIDWDGYRQVRKNIHNNARYGDNFYTPAKAPLSLSNDCEKRLVTNVDKKYFHKHKGDPNFGQPLLGCVSQLNNQIKSEVFTYGKKSPLLGRFYEEIMPNLAKQQPWLTGGFHDYSKNKNGVPHADQVRQQTFNMRHSGVVMRLMWIYSWYADYYGTTPDQDQLVINWWETFEKSMQPSILHRDYSRDACKSDLMQRVRKNSGNGGAANVGEWNRMVDSCNNVASYHAYTYALMGAAFKNSDYTNEAIHLMGNVVNAADENGVMSDAFRCTHAVGYTTMTGNSMAMAAYVIEASTGVWTGDMTFGSKGTTVGDVIDNAVQTIVNPNRESVMKDAYKGCVHYKNAGQDLKIKDYTDLKDQWVEMEVKGSAWSKRDVTRAFSPYSWYLYKTNQESKYKKYLKTADRYLLDDIHDWRALTVVSK
jgi:hypothetical protein